MPPVPDRIWPPASVSVPVPMTLAVTVPEVGVELREMGRRPPGRTTVPPE